MRSYWTRAGTKSNDWCPYKEPRGDTDIHRGRGPCDNGNEDGSVAATNLGLSRTACSPQKPEEAGKDSALEPWEGAWYCDTLI